MTANQRPSGSEKAKFHMPWWSPTSVASISIQAQAHAVFGRVADLSRWNDRNPFPSMDPTTISSHNGPASGLGAVFLYEGKRPWMRFRSAMGVGWVMPARWSDATDHCNRLPL